MDIICISLGGSIVSRKNGTNVNYLKRFLGLLEGYKDKYKFVIAVGGGYACRVYIQSLKEHTTNNFVLDEVAIAITRINALIVKEVISSLDICPNIVTSLDELKSAIKINNVVVLGGLIPGMSTDAVIALACEIVKGKFIINVSNQAYVYDRHPSLPGARKFDRLSHAKLVDMAVRHDSREAGSHFLFDLVGSRIAKRSGLEIKFVNDSIEDLNRAIEDKEYTGTLVTE